MCDSLQFLRKIENKNVERRQEYLGSVVIEESLYNVKFLCLFITKIKIIL